LLTRPIDFSRRKIYTVENHYGLVSVTSNRNVFSRKKDNHEIDNLLCN